MDKNNLAGFPDAEHKFELVKVLWIDSKVLGEWEELDHMDHVMRPIVSLGYLVHEDNMCIVLASTYDAENNSVNATIWIPKGCVVERSSL